MEIAARSPEGVAPYKTLWREIPKVLELTEADREWSASHIKEEMWQQRVRNIAANSGTAAVSHGHLVHLPWVGFQITASGRQYLDMDLFKRKFKNAKQGNEKIEISLSQEAQLEIPPDYF